MFKSIIALVIAFSLIACTQEPQAPKKELLIYSGITMIEPVRTLVKEFEQTHNVHIHITQGGSQDLYQALKTSKQGDLYIPGSSSYRINNSKDNLLGRYELLGHNQLAIVFAKHNPKNIQGNLQELLDNDLNLVLGSPELGSVGRASKKILDAANITQAAYKKAVYLTSDSRRITNAIKNGEADIALNWLATAFWKENKDAIAYKKVQQSPKRIEINLLNFSKEKELANTFIDFISSEHGLNIFKQYGF
jgi:molybdate transport system substrate-binding protein